MINDIDVTLFNSSVIEQEAVIVDSSVSDIGKNPTVGTSFNNETVTLNSSKYSVAQLTNDRNYVYDAVGKAIYVSASTYEPTNVTNESYTYNAIAYDPNSEALVTVSNERCYIFKWNDSENTYERSKLIILSDTYRAITYDPTRNTLVAVGDSGACTILKWNDTTYEYSNVTTNNMNIYYTITYDPERDTLVAVDNVDKCTILKWNDNEKTYNPSNVTIPLTSYRGLVYDPNSEALVAVGSGGKCIMLKWNDKENTYEYSNVTTNVSDFYYGITYDPVHNTLVAVGDSGTCTMLKWNDKENTYEYSNVTTNVSDSYRAITYDPTRNTLVAVGYGGKCIMLKWNDSENTYEYSNVTTNNTKSYAAITYDPTRNTLVAVCGISTYTIFVSYTNLLNEPVVPASIPKPIPSTAYLHIDPNTGTITNFSNTEPSLQLSSQPYVLATTNNLILGYGSSATNIEPIESSAFTITPSGDSTTVTYSSFFLSNVSLTQTSTPGKISRKITSAYDLLSLLKGTSYNLTPLISAFIYNSLPPVDLSLVWSAIKILDDRTAFQTTTQSTDDNTIISESVIHDVKCYFSILK